MTFVVEYGLIPADIENQHRLNLHCYVLYLTRLGFFFGTLGLSRGLQES